MLGLFLLPYSTLIIQHRVAYDYYNNFQNVVGTYISIFTYSNREKCN